MVSVPTWIYRAFTNVGVDDGFLFSGLGRDDTGGILWGPWTIDKARQAGVYLTEDYRMIDTRRGEVLPKDVRLLEPMSAQEIADLEDWSPERMAQRVVRFANLNWSTQALLDSVLPGHGASMAPVVGLGMHQGRAVIPPVANAHGMSIEWLRIPPGGRVGRHRLSNKQALVLKQGRLQLQVEADDGVFTQDLIGTDTAWDAYAMPADHWRSLVNTGDQEALVLLLTSGDEKKVVTWDAAIGFAKTSTELRDRVDAVLPQLAPVIADLAAKYGRTPSQIVLRWQVQQPGTVAIPKSVTPERIRSNLDIFDFTLTQDEMEAIRAHGSREGRLIKPDFSPHWD